MDVVLFRNCQSSGFSIFHTAVTHPLDNREFAAVPHAQDGHRAPPLSGDQACAQSLWRKAQLAVRL